MTYITSICISAEGLLVDFKRHRRVEMNSLLYSVKTHCTYIEQRSKWPFYSWVKKREVQYIKMPCSVNPQVNKPLAAFFVKRPPKKGKKLLQQWNHCC